MEPILSRRLSIHYLCILSSFIFYWSTFFIFRNVIQVHPAKLNRKAREGIYQFAIFSKLFLSIKIPILFKTIISNRISDHWILPSYTNCMKHIIKHNMILGIYIPSSQVLGVWYQGRILVRRIQNIFK